jgi:hypothetical protein
MQDNSNNAADVLAELKEAGYEEPKNPYPDTIEGKLNYLADLSAFYSAQKKVAKSNFKREYYQKKLVKNNKKLYKLLVRTPNSYNPFIKQVVNNPIVVEDEKPFIHSDEVIVPFCQVVEDEPAPIVSGVTTYTGTDATDIDPDAIIAYKLSHGPRPQ